MAQQWQAAVQTQAQVYKSRSLYQGRSIVNAEAASKALGGQLFIVSAGLGIVSASQDVPAYDCTVSPGSPLSKLLATDGAAPSSWWTWLTQDKPSPLSQLLRNATAYVAMPASYIRLVRDDLSKLEVEHADRLRIFTSVAGSKEVPTHLAQNVMPYDERLESLSGFAGTRGDFPQRAMLHFVHALGGQHLPLEQARAKVLTALAPLSRREHPERVRMTDDQIQKVLLAQWDNHAGSSTRLLRYLRDEALVSCEQGRFTRLWQALAAEQRA